MSHQQIIEQTNQLLIELPEEQAAEVRDFAAFLRARQPARAAADEAALTRQIVQHVETAEDNYSLADVQFHYDAPNAHAAD